MKSLKLTGIAALSLSALLGSTPVFANVVRDVNTEGEISFRAGDDQEDIVVIPPEIPEEEEVEIPPLNPNDRGPLHITYAPTLRFGEQVISSQDQSYAMIAERQTLSNGSGETIPYVSFVQVRDVRGTNTGWTLQVAVSEFEDQNIAYNSLTGAELKFSNPWIRYEGVPENLAPELRNDPELVLIPGGDHQPIMTALDGYGAGISSVVWGRQTEIEAIAATTPEGEEVLNPNIELEVPGSTVVSETTYKANLSWQLTNVPHNEG